MVAARSAQPVFHLQTDDRAGVRGRAENAGDSNDFEKWPAQIVDQRGVLRDRAAQGENGVNDLPMNS
jgi:hypothetical protein